MLKTTKTVTKRICGEKSDAGSDASSAEHLPPRASLQDRSMREGSLTSFFSLCVLVCDSLFDTDPFALSLSRVFDDLEPWGVEMRARFDPSDDFSPPLCTFSLYNSTSISQPLGEGGGGERKGEERTAR